MISISATSTPKVKYFAEEYLLFPNFPLLILFHLKILGLTASNPTLYVIAFKNKFSKPVLIM